jgi:hypothetical protein
MTDDRGYTGSPRNLPNSTGGSITSSRFRCRERAYLNFEISTMRGEGEITLVQRMALESGNYGGHALGKLMVMQFHILGIIALLYDP